MCSNESQASRLGAPVAAPAAMIPYALGTLKQISEGAGASTAPAHHMAAPGSSGAATAAAPPGSLLPQAALDHYRIQLYNYAVAERLRFAHPALALPSPYPTGGLAPRPQDFSLYPYFKYDPRLYRAQEEPKPQHSYIGLIAMAILSSPDKKLVLSDIYQYILDNYAYFRSRGPGWRNSIRHNLSLNDCFIKAGRSANGKGHYWAIHPANLEDFKKGDFRRRKAQRKVRKHMGLAVDDEDSPSPTPPPSPPPPPQPAIPAPWAAPRLEDKEHLTTVGPKKRQFDMASLLAPDDDAPSVSAPPKLPKLVSASEDDEDIDVVTEDRPEASPRSSPTNQGSNDERAGSPQGPPIRLPGYFQTKPEAGLWGVARGPEEQERTPPASAMVSSTLHRVFTASFASVEELNRYYEHLKQSVHSSVVDSTQGLPKDLTRDKH